MNATGKLMLKFFCVLPFLAACAPLPAENFAQATRSPTRTITGAPTLANRALPSLPFLPTSTATPPSIPTSTPWPTVDPTVYATRYVTPPFSATPTPNSYAQLKELYRQMIGEWWGKLGVSVNRQGRKVQFCTVVFYEQCEMGQICGQYHFENGCFGELVLNDWRPTFLVFRNLEYSGKAACPNWRPINVTPFLGDRLNFSFAYRDEQSRRVNKGVVLRRK